MSARNKRLHTRQETDGAYVRVEVLLEKRKEVERQLQFRQRELRFLQQLQGQQMEREEEEREELKAVLMGKDTEVRQLQDQLREVERELGGAREEARNLREELQRVTVELAEKSAQVGQLTGVDKEHVGDLPQKWEYEGGDGTDPIFSCYQFQRSSSQGN